MEGALRVLAGELPSSAPVSPSKSWYTLSTDTARPDPTWPVWVTVQLRRSDGTVAAGIDESVLSPSARPAP